jgi:hypothetical protein
LYKLCKDEFNIYDNFPQIRYYPSNFDNIYSIIDKSKYLEFKAESLYKFVDKLIKKSKSQEVKEINGTDFYNYLKDSRKEKKSVLAHFYSEKVI